MSTETNASNPSRRRPVAARPVIEPKRTTILIPYEMPDRYCMRTEGNCLEPVFSDNDPLLIDKTSRPSPGDFVVIWRRRDLVTAGEHQIIVKRLLRFGKVNGAECVIVEMLNPRVSFALPLAGVEAIHLCCGLVPKSIKRIKTTDEELISDMRAQRSAA